MYEYGKTSKQILSGADHKLIFIFEKAIELGLIDISILESIRVKKTQDRYYKEGKSKVKWPNGKHNITEKNQKSKAIDAAPFVNGKASFDYKHCIFLAGVVCGLGETYNIKIRWGGNWDMDGEPVTDQEFQDLVHYELA